MGFYNNTANSTPPDSGSEFITNPYNYEDGYDSSNYYTITMVCDIIIL